MRDFQKPGRSPVFAGEAMAATSHPLATMIAIDTLKAGGTAADAAVAAVAALSVFEPGMTGIGGDCFCIVAQPGKPVWGYNGSGRSAAAARAGRLAGENERNIAPGSIHAVTVPGAVDAWAAILAAHGRFGLDRALAPAIRYAEQGAPVAPRVADDWAYFAHLLRNDPGASRHLLPHGRPPVAGDVIRMPALAESLKAIAKDGPRAFYEGAIARDIVETLRARGSFLALDDFARHRGEAVTLVSTNYRGRDVLELPPNGQGITALILLNVLEQFALSGLDPVGAERFHLAVEAARLAYGVRDIHVSDPAAMQVEVAALLDKGFAAGLAKRIDPAKRVALPPVPAYTASTVYLTVVDRDRMAVSLINSLFRTFGVAIATEKTGILLHNRGHGFVTDPAHPNAFGPGRRPLHTIIPGLVMRDGRCEMPFGVMGGQFQAMGHALFLSNLADFGMDVQEAIDAPRAFFAGERTEVERGVPAGAVAGLRAMGHDVVEAVRPLGGGQAIIVDWERGVLIGGSEPRKDGCAMGY